MVRNINSFSSGIHLPIAIISFALLLRILAVLFIVDPSTPTGDVQHDMYAVNIINGNGFRIDNLLSIQGGETPGSFGLDTLFSFKPPLYPMFLATIYSTCDRNFLAVGIIQAFLGSLSCLILFQISKRIFDEKVGLISTSIFALYPYFVLQGTKVMDTTLFTFLTVISILYLYKVTERPTSVNMVAAGIIMGLAILCRPIFLPFIPFVFVWLWFSSPSKKIRVLKIITITSIFIILTVLPWTVRNYMVHGRLVLLGTNGGYTFWQANNQFTEKYIKMRSDLDPIAFNEGIDWKEEGLYGLSEVEQNSWFYKEGVGYIYNHPFDLVRLSALKFLSLWSWHIYPSSESKLKNAIYTFTYGPILIMAIAGIVLSHNRWEKTSLLLLLFFAFTIVYAIFYGKTIYRSPLDPFLFVFSAYTLRIIWNKIKSPVLGKNFSDV
ncbi:MAG: ArnT family glycosyltransferase [Candidatus Scalinduaceae bacterium]